MYIINCNVIQKFQVTTMNKWHKYCSQWNISRSAAITTAKWDQGQSLSYLEQKNTVSIALSRCKSQRKECIKAIDTIYTASCYHHVPLLHNVYKQWWFYVSSYISSIYLFNDTSKVNYVTTLTFQWIYVYYSDRILAGISWIIWVKCVISEKHSSCDVNSVLQVYYSLRNNDFNTCISENLLISHNRFQTHNYNEW